MDGIEIARRLLVAVGLILVDLLRDGGHWLAALRLRHPRIGTAFAAAADESVKQRAIYFRTGLILREELDHQGFAAGLGLDRSDPGAGGEVIAGPNRLDELHVLLAMQQANYVDLQIGIADHAHDRGPDGYHRVHWRRDDSARAGGVEERGIVVVVRARVVL